MTDLDLAIALLAEEHAALYLGARYGLTPHTRVSARALFGPTASSTATGTLAALAERRRSQVGPALVEQTFATRYPDLETPAPGAADEISRLGALGLPTTHITGAYSERIVQAISTGAVVIATDSDSQFQPPLVIMLHGRASAPNAALLYETDVEAYPQRRPRIAQRIRDLMRHPIVAIGATREEDRTFLSLCRAASADGIAPIYVVDPRPLDDVRDDWYPAPVRHVGTTPAFFLARLQTHLERARSLAAGLSGAAPTQDDLGGLVRAAFAENLADIAPMGDLPAKVNAVVKWAADSGRWADLLAATLVRGARDPRLQRLAWELISEAPPGAHLESVVIGAVPFVDPPDWRARMTAGEGRVCRVGTPTQLGSGFLVGPDLVLTANHVVGSTPPQQVDLLFDYKVAVDAVAPAPGSKHRTAEIVARNPVLDFALLRVEGTPGAGPRGWLTPDAHTPKVGEPLLILQHPMGDPLKMCAGSVSSVQSAVLRYTTNTRSGSSGSPCFTLDWRLVALHTSGSADANHATPLPAIVAALQQQGKALAPPFSKAP
jgi:S1-C subfamily serine protease